ncbi:MAG: NUDIX hydrolase [Rhodobacteraceae bacterium]|nr:NUDIX hydrolase [Paracoccaceae bacterium]MAY44805.1 NUDIX hydrolase [Paracoccaceae bacterium]QEW21766.1 NUDIX domain protein [Marinibacterium anthonyi]
MLVKQMPLEVRPLCKSDMRTQFAALCHRRRAGRTEVLLVTSRGTGRWIAPKGWPVAGLTPAETALQEAWEEAGVRGRVEDLCLGLYSYVKIVEDGPDLPCVVMVYPVKVKALARRYPEAGQRRRKWLTPAKAADRVDEPELARILRDFDPDRLP